MLSWNRWSYPPATWIFSLCALAVACFLGRPLLLTRFCQQQPSSVVPRSCSAGIEGHRFTFLAPTHLCHGQVRDCVVPLQLTLRSAKDLDAEGEDISPGQGVPGTPCRVYVVVDHREHATAEAPQELRRITEADIGGGGKDPVWGFTFALSLDARATQEAFLTFSFMCEDAIDDDRSDRRQVCIGNAEVPVADLLGGKGYAQSRTSGEIMATAQVFDGAGKPHGLLFYSFKTTIQQDDETGSVGTEVGVGLESLQADQLTFRAPGLSGLIFWLLGRGCGGVTAGLLGLSQRVLSLVWGVGSGVWGVALGCWPILWLAVQGILDVVAALWYLVYMLGAILVMGVWSLLSMLFGGRRS